MFTDLLNFILQKKTTQLDQIGIEENLRLQLDTCITDQIIPTKLKKYIIPIKMKQKHLHHKDFGFKN